MTKESQKAEAQIADLRQAFAAKDTRASGKKRPANKCNAPAVKHHLIYALLVGLFAILLKLRQRLGSVFVRLVAPQPAEADANVAGDWSARRHLRLGLIGFGVLFFGFGTWSVSVNIAGAIISSGQVAVESNRQVVQHPDGGVVVDIKVREGSRVEAGDVLIRFDEHAMRSEYEILSAQLSEFDARVARLSAEQKGDEQIHFPDALLEAAQKNDDVAQILEGQKSLFQTKVEIQSQELEQFRRRQEQISSQIKGVDAQLDALYRQSDLAREELDTMEQLLSRGLAERSSMIALQSRSAGLLGQSGELMASRSELEGRITEIDLQILQVTSQAREAAIAELRDLSLQRSEAEQRIKALEERMLRLDVTAPVSGIVYDMQVFAQRSVIRPAEPILYIVPQEQALVVQTRIDPVHIDLVHARQPVSLRFSSFDPNETPELQGKIVRVSPDAFTDQATGETYYQAEVRLDDGEVERLNGQAMLPGMPVEAFIRTNDRTPLAYILQPFTDYFHRAFREE